MLRVLRWMCGYVSFKVSGGFPEKFINNVVKENINLWDLKRINGDLYAKTLISDYKLLRRKARKSNSKIKIREKYGWPILAFKYKKRIGLIIGSIAFIGILYIFSLYVWSINVTGNDRISTSEVLNVMKDLGVGMGSKKSDIDSRLLKQSVMSKLDDISWISINVKGSCLNVSIKEKVRSPDIIGEGVPCNIVAKCEGQIERLEVYKGTACVKEGDAVLEGQVLISGVKQGEDGNTSFSDANGKIFAITKHKITEKVKLNQLNTVDTGDIVKKYGIEIFGKKIPLNPWRTVDEQYRTENSNQVLSIFGIEFPIVICTDLCYHQECEEKFLTPEEAEKILEQKISEREKTELSNSKILSRNIESREEDNDYISEVIYSCVKDIAEKKEIYFE